MRLMQPVRRRRDRGAVIPMVALSLSVLMTMTAFAVDLGRMRTERRDLQADADAIALDAAQMIRGLAAPAAQVAATTEAQESATRNGVDPSEIQHVQVGSWDVATQTFTPMSGPSEFPNAVEVLLTDAVDMFFDFSTDSRSVSRRAVAVATGQAQAELGSVFAGVQLYDPADISQCSVPLDAQLTFMNQIYSELLGIEGGGQVVVDGGTVDCSVTGPADGLALDVASWRGLASSRVQLATLASNMGVASADALLDQTVSVKDLLEGSASSLAGGSSDTNADAVTALLAISQRISQDLQVDLLDVFQANAGAPSSGAADLTLNVLQLLSASAMAIDGSNFARLELPINLPGATTTIRPAITVVEPPKLDTFKSAYQPGPETAQVRFAVDVPLAGLGLNPALLGGLLAVQPAKTGTGNIGIVGEVGRARATYGAIGCATPEDGSTVDLTVETGAVTATMGLVSEQTLSGPLEASVFADLDPVPLVNGSFSTLVGLGLVKLDLTQGTNLSTELNLLGAEETKPFVGPFATAFKRYHGGLSGSRLTDSLYSQTDLDLNAGLLSSLLTSETAVRNMVGNALAGTLAELQLEVIDPMLAAVGVTVAGADARIHDIRCSVPALANRD